MADFHKPSSPYRRTPVRDFYLDLWNQPDIGLDNAEEVVISQKYDRRPDLMAYDYFGTPNLWWVFAIINKDVLVDPTEDFRAGITINVPSKGEVAKLI